MEVLLKKKKSDALIERHTIPVTEKAKETFAEKTSKCKFKIGDKEYSANDILRQKIDELNALAESLTGPQSA